MSRIGVFVLFTVALVGCSVPAEKPPTAEEELAKFQGTWQQVSSRANGEDLPEEILRENQVTYAGNKKSVKLSGSEIVGGVLVELNPSVNPRAIDETVVTQTGDRFVILGIYKVEGDTLTSCIAPVGEPRPTEFVSKAGSGHTLQTFRRVPEGKKN